MNLLKSKIFWISISLLGIGLLILWLRKYKCENGVYPWQDKMPGFVYKKCSFWTAQQIELPEPVENSSVPLNQVRDTYSIVISKSDGAVIYKNQNNIFVATEEKVPYQTQLTGKLLNAQSGTWFETDKGWLNGNDVSTNTQSPH